MATDIVNHKLATLRKRAEFLAVAASGKRWVAADVILQIGVAREAGESVRFGVTASGKIGNAVIRNRAKRRLRALAAELFPNILPAHDYVLVARATTPACAFDKMRRDLIKGMKRMGVWKTKF